MATTTPPNEAASRNSMDDAYSHLKQAGNSVRDAARSAGSEAQNRAHEQYDRGRQSAEAFAVQAEEQIKQRPLAAVGVAFAAGWLISRLLR